MWSYDFALFPMQPMMLHFKCCMSMYICYLVLFHESFDLLYGAFFNYLLKFEFHHSVFLVRTLMIRYRKDGFEIPFHNFQHVSVLDLTIGAWIEVNISCRTTFLNIKSCWSLLYFILRNGLNDSRYLFISEYLVICEEFVPT